MSTGRETYPGRRARNLWLPAALILLAALAALVLALAPAAEAEPRTIIFDWLATPSWTSVTNPIAGVGASVDDTSDVRLTKGEVVFVAGERDNAAGNSDMTLVKYKSGVKLWTVDYNGPGNGGDESEQMALSPDGKFVYITGVAVNAAGNTDLIVLKRSAKTGALKWARRYNGPAHLNDEGDAIGVDDSGNIVAGGYSMNAADPDWVVVSYTAAGDRRWVWRYKAGAGAIDIIYDMLVSADGTAYVCGFSATAAWMGAVTARLTSWGTKMWVKKYAPTPPQAAQATCLAARPGGGVYVAGYVSSPVTQADGLLIRYSPTGKRTLFTLDTAGGGATNEVFYDVAVTSTKDTVAVGFSGAADTDCRVAAYHTDGSLWAALSLPGPWNDRFVAVAADKLGGYYALGTHHVAAGDCKILTVRGSVLGGGGGWYSQWGPVASTNNLPSAIAVRGTTCCVVGQHDSGGATGIDQAVLTYVY